jgi:hypothetical protein
MQNDFAVLLDKQDEWLDISLMVTKIALSVDFLPEAKSCSK